MEVCMTDQVDRCTSGELHAVLQPVGDFVHHKYLLACKSVQSGGNDALLAKHFLVFLLVLASMALWTRVF